MSNKNLEIITNDLSRPILKTSGTYYFVGFLLAAGVIWGIIAYIVQLTQGLQVTGMNNNVAWGMYITNFVFFIGISHAGTLISAILRVSGAEWRRPITRVAEAITVFALVLGGIQVLLDMGRPERAMNAIFYGRLGSPLLWDVTCITIYLMSSLFYLLLPLIPDLGILRDNPDVQGWRKDLYRILSFGWDGNPEQKRRLEIAIGVLAIAIIPIAISVHSVVSWYGAIYSGIAALIVAMAIIRKVYNLQGYLKPIHFNFLGILLLTMTALWFYFTLSEFLTVGYGGLTEEMHVFHAKVTGPFAGLFWFMIASMTIAFIMLVFFRQKHPIGATLVASFFIIVGMWIERYSIIVPTLTKYLVPNHDVRIYAPSWVEWSITIASFCGFILLYFIFVKLFPIISIWEVEEAEEALEEKIKAIKNYSPTPGASVAGSEE